MQFFDTLNYSSCNEDGAAELRALGVSSGDRVCCITGGGDRALHMLLGDPASVLSFDMNPAQNHLLELKLAAIKEFDYAEYVRFLGLIPSPSPRSDSYRILRPLLSDAAARWWDARGKMLADGVLYAGRWERFFKLTSRNLRLWRGAKIRRLFAFDDIAEQREFVRREWDTPAWRVSIRAVFNSPVLRFVFGDPGFYRNTRGAVPPWKHIHGRINSYLARHLARDSFMLALVLRGEFFDSPHYPPYLQERNFDVLKARAHRITIRTASLAEISNSDETRAFDKYSLSDVPSFLDPSEHRALLEFFNGKKGVRFCIREFLTRREIPAGCDIRNLRFLRALQEELAADDASLGYTFIIGENTL